ncbi:DUF6731 family protein [Crocosphaera sp. Alani8]|uniref:DUF6731 family protein n=1 Tax=Crocosphaera sp. Alani8 TaxID=3038952 RepID=UPI00313F3779
MSQKTITVHFYRVEISETGTLSFESLIEQVLDKPREQRMMQIRAAPLWLYDASIDREFVEGDMIRLGMNEIPPKGDLTGNIENIYLNDNEGLVMQSAFLYHIPTKVLLLQNRQGGISPNNLAKYLMEINKIDNTIFVDPILSPEILRKLENMKDVRNIEVKVAKLDNLEIFAPDDLAVKDINEMRQYFQAPSLELKLSVGRAKHQSLEPQKSKNFLRNMLRLGGNNTPVKKLRISGHTDDNELLKINLLEDRMSAKIKHDFKDRTLGYDERKEILKQAWEKKSKEILKMSETSQ